MTALNEHRRVYFFAALLLVLIYLFAGFYPFHLNTHSNYHAWKVIPFVYSNIRAAVADSVVNLLGFVPFGWLLLMLRWPRSGLVLAIVLSAIVSGTIEVGQLFFSGRVPATEDIIMNTLGGALGAYLAGTWLKFRSTKSEF